MQTQLITLLTMVQEAATHGHGGEAGPIRALDVIAVIPFVAILLCIAVIPLVNEHWWHPNRNKAIVSFLLGVPMGAIYFVIEREAFMHTAHEYFSFICLLGALFIISGGINIRGSFAGSPVANSGIIFVGAVLASFIGTTGAAMVLIRPLLKSILWRRRPEIPVIFFIFLVANIGGLLTPLGDPPLFLGYLNGVPFSWTFKLVFEWAFMVFLVLAVYFIFDSVLYKRDLAEHPEHRGASGEAFGIDGALNFLWLGVVLCTTAFVESSPWRELGYIGAALIGWFSTQAEIRERNQFTFHPISEVAILFAGIFACMIPCLLLLERHGAQLGVHTPGQFFWATGTLSSFLDNAPTYLTFFSLAKGLEVDPSATYVANTGVAEHILEAISLGAVFMGANTYIGNGPNFMVKAIAEEWKIKMPSFFGYMAWSICILIPLFFILHLVLFSGTTH